MVVRASVMRRVPVVMTPAEVQMVLEQLDGTPAIVCRLLYVEQPSGGLGQQGRHHLDGSIVQKEVSRAAVCSGMAKPASCHSFRHSFATPRHTVPRRSALSSQGHL
jgi:hypothetical protein